MKKTFFAILMIFLSIASFAQKISPDNIIGIWKCEEYKIEIFKNGGTYSAKLLWAKDMFEADGKTPKKDDQNPDQKLKARSRQGLTHITGLTFKNGEYINGKLYSVQDKKYDFFDYSTNEALFLSEKEEKVINNIISNIKEEYHGNIDKFSQDIIISHLETLFNYCERFYQRQFITRKITNSKILGSVEKALNDYIDNEDLASKGLPTVQYLADSQNISPKYLTSLLKQLTGLTAQQHIHEKLIEKAKEKLTTTELSI